MEEKVYIRLETQKELRRKFKAICADQDKTMTEVLEILMTKYVEDSKEKEVEGEKK